MAIDDKQISIAAYLDEVRKRLVVVLIFFVIFAGLSFYFIEDILHFLKLSTGPQLGTLSVFSPTTAILAFIKIGFFTGFILTIPVLLYEVWMFILPALERKHARYGLLFALSGIVLFMRCLCFISFPSVLRDWHKDVET